jgi:hypothetical protein
MPYLLLDASKDAVAEAMTQALLRTCPGEGCSAQFFKEEGCNKMTCISLSSNRRYKMRPTLLLCMQEIDTGLHAFLESSYWSKARE